VHTLQGRTAKLNISLNTSSKENQSNLGVNGNCSNSIEITAEAEDMDVPENVEEIIEMLLSGLRDMVCLKGESLIVNFMFHPSTKL